MEGYLICYRSIFLPWRNSWRVMFSTGWNGCFTLRSGKKCNFLRRWQENFLFLWYAITSSVMVLNKVLPCLQHPSSFGGWDFENFHSFIFMFTTSFRSSLNVRKKKEKKIFFLFFVLLLESWDSNLLLLKLLSK